MYFLVNTLIFQWETLSNKVNIGFYARESRQKRHHGVFISVSPMKMSFKKSLADNAFCNNLQCCVVIVLRYVKKKKTNQTVIKSFSLFL